MGKNNTKQPKLQYRTFRFDADSLLDDDQKRRVSETAGLAREVYAKAAADCCALKITSRRAIQGALYEKYLGLFPSLPSAILQDTLFRAGESVKSWNSNVPRYNESRKKKNAKIAKANKRREAKGLPPLREKPMLEKWALEIDPRKPFNYRLDGRTLSHMKKAGAITFSAIGKRVTLPFLWPKHFAERYDVSEWKLQAGTVGVDDGGNVVMFLSASYMKEEKPREEGEAAGPGLGQKHKYAASGGEIHDSRQISRVKRKYAYNRRSLAQKGTPSAKRKLKRVGKKESRFMRDANHCMAKNLASDKSVRVYVLEDLTGIRGKEAKGGDKMGNRNSSNWAFRQFGEFLAYKCRFEGIAVEHVDPYKTSQRCSACGSEGVRRKGRFTCPSCGYTGHADINAAINIRDNYLRHGSGGRPTSTGQTAGHGSAKVSAVQPDTSLGPRARW